MRGTKIISLLILIMSGLVSINGLADRIEVFNLQNRDASEVTRIIKPLLGPETGISGQGYQLIIRGDDATLNQVRQILADIDRKPRRLLISLRRGANTNTSDNRFSASGTVRSGDARISVNGNHKPRVSVHETRRNTDNGAIHRVNGVEGRQSFIQVGKLIPVGESFYTEDGRRGGTVRYQSATSGFYVLPQLVGEHVNLQISQNNISLNRHGKQVFDTQRVITTLRARLGEWVSLANISQSSRESGSGIAYSTSRSGSNNLDLDIKVEIVSD